MGSNSKHAAKEVEAVPVECEVDFWNDLVTHILFQNKKTPVNYFLLKSFMYLST